ncbi:MAG: NAD-dependent epimerase/dehydratase family protein [Bdellovibrionota bacterium]
MFYEVVKELGIKYLVHTSSPSVVFDGTDQEGLDEKAPFAKSYLSHYPSTKAMAEKLVLAANSADLSTVALRPHLIWGPGDNHIAPRLLKMGRNGRLRLIGKVDKLVDTIYIDNAVDAHILAMEGLMKEEPISGKAYFITNQEPILASKFVNGILKAGKVPEITKRIPANIAYGVGAVCEMIYKVMGIKSDPPMTRFVARQLSTAHWYDTKAAKQELGYIAKVSIDEGFKRLGKSLGP